MSSKAKVLAKGVTSLLILVPLHAMGDENSIRLKDGPGRDLVGQRCAICHSLDYIVMNSPFLDSAGWQKEMDKMVKVMGAPINAEEQQTILKYLNERYGK